jgi:hypothetical protein
MSDQDHLPQELVFNGLDGSTGDHLLKLSSTALQQIALGHTYRDEHLSELKERDRQKREDKYALEFGRDENKLSEAGWGVVFPARPLGQNQPILDIRDALKELLEWRKEQAGDLYRELMGGDGVRPKDTADKFMVRHKAAPGTVDPTCLPYYLLLVGDATDIPFRFQYELDATYLVGRIHFDTLDEYARYAHSVVAAEKSGLKLPRRAAFFGTAHPGDVATQLSAEHLVKPLAEQLSAKKKDWQVELLPPADSRKARLEQLLGNGDSPALLFTATHGLGFDDPSDKRLLPFQGALICQDLEKKSAPLSRDHYLAAEDIRTDFKLHGLIAFHFACFGAGTPQYDNFIAPGSKKPKQIAPRDFLAALPRRLLGHPKGGALAVIGHIDRAWDYSFRWKEAGQQTNTFRDTLLQLMAGRRAGLALDQFNLRYAQIAVRLTNLLNVAEVVKPEPLELAGLWTANNDARSYALIGDPAVYLPV